MAATTVAFCSLEHHAHCLSAVQSVISNGNVICQRRRLPAVAMHLAALRTRRVPCIYNLISCSANLLDFEDYNAYA